MSNETKFKQLQNLFNHQTELTQDYVLRMKGKLSTEQCLNQFNSYLKTYKRGVKNQKPSVFLDEVLARHEILLRKRDYLINALKNEKLYGWS
ncbi:hypothetical protein MIS33_10795 [Wielerella bovis]|uniref:hypothetical protein n=1 Tax=Wielerella bovis TaxID=2917790 RepID=UPI0020192A80|nr:hypothetical protein [Wielerella bovis]ULJ64599.1 hypothetical protein MIS33_10795 [Wielerella bovis]